MLRIRRIARPLVVALLVFGLGRGVAPAQETAVDHSIALYQALARRSPFDANAYVRLGDAYIQKGRETGDVSYLGLADKALRKSLALAPTNGAAARHLAHVFAARHEFPEAVAQAARAIQLAPDDAGAHGVLGDAYLELGMYDRAGEAYDTMLRLRADLASYGRSSGLKNVRGDARGAIEDLRRAVAWGEANRQPRESLAWARSQLGAEHFAIGEIEAAEARHLAALRTFPGYHRALAGLAQVRTAQGRPDDGVELYGKALAVAPLPEYAVALGDLYTKLGRLTEARRQYDLVEYIGRLNAVNKVLYNRELAYFYADHDVKLDAALELARKEIELRQDLYAHDLLAWALHKAGRSREALASMDQALRLGTLDAKLFFHAGMIHRALGHRERAREYLSRALSINPHFHVLQSVVAERTLAELTRATQRAPDIGRP
jgi:tetratricopeptide (TPR) repeat protein